MSALPFNPPGAQQALAQAIEALAAGLRAWFEPDRAGPVFPAEDEAAPPLLQFLAGQFQLSRFEQRVLLAAAAAEIDTGFAALCGQAQGDPSRPYPTFQLLLSAFRDAHWDAVSPAAPLRRWALVSLSSGETLASSRIRIDERILHFLLDVACVSPPLEGLWQQLPGGQITLPASQQGVAIRAAELLRAEPGRPLVVQLLGADALSRRAVAEAAASLNGKALATVAAHLLPPGSADLQAVARLLERESALTGCVLYLALEPSGADAPRTPPADTLLAMLAAPVLAGADEPPQNSPAETVLLELKKSEAAEQFALWRDALGEPAALLEGTLGQLAGHFHLSAAAIYRNASIAAALGPDLEPAEPNRKPGKEPDKERIAAYSRTLWNTCRLQSRVRMERLAQRVETDSTWDDLILPAREMGKVRAIASQMQQRPRVHQQWGFRSSGGRGTGIVAIFSGLSGTGKTTAAEVLARELHLDLFRVDLSHTISKYIGETSRNLRRVFDSAEEAGAVLLFDEADALFGKRSEVRDSHDRYANAEVSYLLQRMEQYRGLAILTTNMKQAIDQAFMRRVRFVVQFPFPDAAMREAIWHRVLPPGAPVASLNFALLSKLSMTGASIRNIALNGAFLAAESDRPLGMAHLLEAAEAEADKLERALPEQEVRGWA